MQQRIFGESSTLCSTPPPFIEAQGGVEGIITEPIYVILAIAIALLYLVWLPFVTRSRRVRWSHLRRQMQISEISGQSAVGRQRLGVVIVTWLLGVSLISLLGVRLYAQYSTSAVGIDGVGLTVLLTIIVIAAILYEWAGLKIGGYLTIQKDFVNQILSFKHQILFFGIVLLTPLFLICCLANFEQGKIGIQLSMGVVFIFVVIFIRHTFLLFMRQNFSILHWILYLCGVEILPLTLVWAIIVRGCEAGAILGV